MPPLNDLRKQMKSRRKELGLTLTDVSTMTGLSVSYLSEIERGKSKSTLHTLDKVFDYLGIDFDDPLTREEKIVLELWQHRRYKSLIKLTLTKMKS